MNSESISTIILPPEVASKYYKDAIAPEGQEVSIAGKDYLVLPKESELYKAIKGIGKDSTPQPQPYRSTPYESTSGSWMGVKEPAANTPIANKILRDIPRKNPVIAAVIRRRQNQVASFGRLPNFDGDLGFKIRLRDTEREPTPQEKLKIRELENLMLQGGLVREHPETGQKAAWNAEFSERAMSFQKFLRTLVWDSLILDAAAFNIEVGTNEKKWPVVWFSPVDSALIKRTVPKNFGKDSLDSKSGITSLAPYKPVIRPTLKSPAYVMLDPYGVEVIREYGWDELGLLIRNPRSDTFVLGYGYSELEMLVDIIVGTLYGIKYNTEFFDSNHIPPGILLLQGRYSDEVIEAFRRQLRMMVGGSGQFWSLPVLASEATGGSPGQYLKMRDDPGQGMYWREWLLFCTTVTCALYQMDSTEINFVNFGTSQNSLASSTPLGKLEFAQESGLTPLLSQIESFLDETLIRKFGDGEFRFTFTGISQKDVAQENLGRSSRMQLGLTTPNMERARMDLLPIYDPLQVGAWNEIKGVVEKEMGELLLDDDAVIEETKNRYVAIGGKLALWPDAPVGNPGALQIWSQEHQQDLVPPQSADSDNNKEEQKLDDNKK